MDKNPNFFGEKLPGLHASGLKRASPLFRLSKDKMWECANVELQYFREWMLQHRLD